MYFLLVSYTLPLLGNASIRVGLHLGIISLAFTLGLFVDFHFERIGSMSDISSLENGRIVSKLIKRSSSLGKR